MTRIKGKIWFAIVIVYAVCLTVLTLSHLVNTPSHVVTEIGGDGIKNIFTYLYESMYGKGYWFTGMNYPYGEHLTYTDGQPLISFFFAKVHNVSAGTALLVMNLLIGFSYVLSVVYNYRILLHFKVAPFSAMLFAGFITVYSPQLFCISGHYALAYMNVIPMLFFLNIKYHESSAWKYCVYAYLLILVMSFLHLYFAAVALIWALLYGVAYLAVVKRPIAARLKHSLLFLAGIVSVFITLAVVMKVSDPVKDRPAIPQGMLSYTTQLRDVWTSSMSPIWRRLRDNKGYTDISQPGEGYTYAGAVTILVVVISLITGIVNIARRKRAANFVREDRFSPVWLCMAFGALLFSMGVPYIWNMEWLLNYTSFMRQFRTLGRFSWIFYYIITIYSSVTIYAWYSASIMKQRRVQGYTILIFAIALWTYEAKEYVKYSRAMVSTGDYNYNMLFSTGEQNWTSFLSEHHYVDTSFQAILLLPYFHVGTEKIWIDADWVATMGMKASLQLQLPIIDVMMSRSSWAQAKKQVKLVAGPYAGKPTLSDIKSNKPFLVLHFENDSLNPDQRYLLEAADYIGHYSQCRVYACYPQRLTANGKRYADRVKQLLPFMRQDDSCVGSTGAWYVDHMDKGKAGTALFGSGASPRISASDSVIYVLPTQPVRDSQQYELSAWFLLTDKDYGSPSIFMDELDSAGNTIQKVVMGVKESTDNYDMWFRGSVYFYMRANCRALRCNLVNTPNPSYVIMDELLLRPADALIISKAADGGVMVNNHIFHRNDAR